MKILNRAKKQKGDIPGFPRQNLAGKIQIGQKSQASILGIYGGGSGILSKRKYIFDIDVDELRKYPTDTLLKNLHYLNPDASMAVWTLLRLCASGWSLKVTTLDGSENPQGYYYLANEVIPYVNRDRGGFDAFMDVLHKTTLILGAPSCEVVVAANKKSILDIVPIDPATIHFKPEKLSDGRERYIPYQYQMHGEVSLDKPGFYYVPLDVDIGDPNGISPIVSMLQIIFFQMQVMSDLQRVVHNQGWPRLDVSILEEVIRNKAPRSLLTNPKKLAEFMDIQMGLIKEEYSKIHPDDAFVHTDAVKVDAKGPSQQLGSNAKAILDTIDKNLANSLHILSIFLNKQRGNTETYGSVQWKIQVKTIQSFQRACSRIINDALTFALNIAGIQGYATVVYEPIPTESPFQAEEALLMKVRRVTYLRDAGYIKHDTAASMLIDAEYAEDDPHPMFYDEEDESDENSSAEAGGQGEGGDTDDDTKEGDTSDSPKGEKKDRLQGTPRGKDKKGNVLLWP
jgi:hypothetical protein